MNLQERTVKRQIVPQLSPLIGRQKFLQQWDVTHAAVVNDDPDVSGAELDQQDFVLPGIQPGRLDVQRDQLATDQQSPQRIVQLLPSPDIDPGRL